MLPERQADPLKPRLRQQTQMPRISRIRCNNGDGTSGNPAGASNTDPNTAMPNAANNQPQNPGQPNQEQTGTAKPEARVRSLAAC